MPVPRSKFREVIWNSSTISWEKLRSVLPPSNMSIKLSPSSVSRVELVVKETLVAPPSIEI
jgi:hypothetical protein